MQFQALFFPFHRIKQRQIQSVLLHYKVITFLWGFSKLHDYRDTCFWPSVAEIAFSKFDFIE